MPSQIQKPKPQEKKEDTPAPKAGDLKAKGEKIKEGLTDLMDEIDEVLEQNAEEFVKAYVQRGGQ
jgi:ubiquitin-like protein Pup